MEVAQLPRAQMIRVHQQARRSLRHQAAIRFQVNRLAPRILELVRKKMPIARVDKKLQAAVHVWVAVRWMAPRPLMGGSVKRLGPTRQHALWCRQETTAPARTRGWLVFTVRLETRRMLATSTASMVDGKVLKVPRPSPDRVECACSKPVGTGSQASTDGDS